MSPRPLLRPTKRTSDSRKLRDKRDDRGGIYDGTVGWNDGSSHFDVDNDSGVTLVRVTLFIGRNPDADDDSDADDSLARGHQVLCRIGSLLNSIPALGTQVIVAMPANRMLEPGGGVIIEQVAKNPSTQFSDARAKMDLGPDFDLVIKARSITLTDYENRFLTLGPKFGLKAGDADGSGFVLKNSKWVFYAAVNKTAVCSLELSANKIFAVCKPSGGGDSSGFKFNGGNCTVMCQQYANTASSGMLGGTASPVSGMQYGPGLGVPSTSWKVAP